ncbi:MAG: LptF/LptG family permease [Sphaerochaetaceae bacterium]|nr:LptF/LptG family permease [Sphaerochaetaceae bacterium]
MILKVGLATAFLAALIMLGADLFSKLESYVTNSVSGQDMLKLTLLHLPKALLMVSGPAFLFSVTYYLSMLYARNEIICILGSGVSYARVVLICVLTCLGVSLLSFSISETIALNCENKRNVLYESLTDTSAESGNNSAIALSDMYNGYSVYAEQYVDSTRTLSRIVIIEKMEEGFIKRTDAVTGTWDEENQCWLLTNGVVYTVENNRNVAIESFDEFLKEDFNLKPRLFRNSSSDIQTMDLPSAVQYVSAMKIVNPEKYSSLATALYKRILDNLIPLVFCIIACSMNYRYKKNVLFLSIVSSVAVAVIYYVCLLTTNLMADQGIIAPYMGSVFPLLLILSLSILIHVFTTGKR